MPPKQAYMPSRPPGTSGSHGRLDDARRRSSGGGGSGIPAPRSRQAAQPPQAQPPHPPRFWQCQEDALLFKGPLGEPVGVSPKDTVVWEQQRYEDPFRGWWLATGTQEGELAWVDYSNSAGAPLLEHAASQPESTWVPVIDAGPSTAADARGPHATASRTAAATAADSEAAQTVPEVPPGVAIEYHAPCGRDGSTGLSLEKFDLLSRQQPPSHLELYEYYWSSLSDGRIAHPDKDWNLTYQRLVEAVLHQTGDQFDTDADVKSRLEAAEEVLFHFLESFYDAAEEVAVLFVKDQMAPTNERCLVAHPHRRDVFYFKGLLVVACIDTPGGLYEGDSNATKAAYTAFRSYTLAAEEGPKNLLYVPLQTVASFHGYTLQISTIPPVDSSGCLYAPMRRQLLASTSVAEDPTSVVNAVHGGTTTLTDEIPDVLRHLCTQFSRAVNLTEHEICRVDPQTGETRTLTTALPLNTELYAGRDRRIYFIAGADRLLPASFPLPVCDGKNSPTAKVGIGEPDGGGRRRSSEASSLSARPSEGGSAVKLFRAAAVQRVRPELLLQWSSPLNCDVAIDGCHCAQDVVASAEVADFVKREAITAVASVLGLQLPVDTIPLPKLPCTLCQSVMENELRFVVCQHTSRCCRICSHCYTKRLYDYFNDPSGGGHADGGDGERHAASSQTWRTRVSFEDAVQCGSAPRPADALTLEPSVSRLAHASGLNLRFLPFVYYRLPATSRFATERYVEVELVARAAAHLLDDKLRRVTSVQDVYATIQQFFASLLQSKAPEAQRFWAKELGPRIETTFHGVCAPLDVSSLSVLLLAERVEILTGIELSAESRVSLTGDKPFIEVHRMTPRVKRIRPPRVQPSQVQGEAERMRGMLSKLLLFWIGHAPKKCNDDWQPLYLQKTDVSNPV